MEYRPRVISPPSNDGLVYLMTCRKEAAASLVDWLKQKDIPASLTGTDVREEMTDGSKTERYVVSEISIDPFADREKVQAAVNSWPALGSL